MHIVLQCCGHKHSMPYPLNEVAAVWVYCVTYSFHLRVFYRVELMQLGNNCTLIVGLVYLTCEENRRFSLFLHHKCVEKRVIPSILYVPGDSQIWLALLYIRECCQARLIYLKCSGAKDPSSYGISVQPVSEVPFFNIPHIRWSSESSSKHIGSRDTWRNAIRRVLRNLHAFPTATPMHQTKWLTMKLAKLIQAICQTRQNEFRSTNTTRI